MEVTEMRYVISDIHGCYEPYRRLLEKINFSPSDELYVLGDAVDRGPEPIKVLRDIMRRPNMHFIMGNHDYVFSNLMGKQLAGKLTKVDLLDVLKWFKDGGEVTAEQYARLPKPEKREILSFLAAAPLYAELRQGEERYLLVHAGLDNFSPKRVLSDYDVPELVNCRADYARRYFPDPHTFLVTGHTPTKYLNPDGSDTVYRANGHIALDCGCVFGGALAAWCIETGEVVYEKGLKSD